MNNETEPKMTLGDYVRASDRPYAEARLEILARFEREEAEHDAVVARVCAETTHAPVAEAAMPPVNVNAFGHGYVGGGE